MSRHRLFPVMSAGLILPFLASAAGAQVVIPTSQVRELRAESNWTDATGTPFGTGPMVFSAPDGDYGFWTDTLFIPGFISGNATQAGGFNGVDTFTLDAVTCNLGGGNGPGTSAEANVEIEFTYTFDVPSPVTYTTSANAGVAPPTTIPDTVVDFLATYTLTGPSGEVFSYQTGPDNNYFFSVVDATGYLPAGSYTLSFVLSGEVSFFSSPDDPDGNGNGGGGGGPSPILVFHVQPGGAPPCPADWDGSGGVNSADISAFLASWLSSLNNGDLNADFDQSGTVNSADISAFLNQWLADLSGGNC